MTLTKTIRLTFLHTPAMTLSGLTPTQFTVMTIISVLRSGVVFSTAGFFQPSQLITVLTITIFRVSIFRLRHMCLLIKLTVQVLKADFNWFLGRNEINFGLDLTRHEILPGRYLPKGDSSLVIPQTIEKERAWEGALYVDDKFVLTNYLSVDAGLRMSGYCSLGPASVMLYDPAYTKSTSTIIDTLNFKPGAITSKYAGLEPRVSLNFRISDRNSFKLNYNRTRQYLHLLSNSASISPTDTWKLCDYYLKPEIGDQVAIGFYELLFKNNIEASAELYYKEIGI